MKKHSCNTYVTEPIRRFDGAAYGVCCPLLLMQQRQENSTTLNLHQWVSVPAQPINEASLIIIPLQKNELQQLLMAPDRYSYLQAPAVRLAINYAQLNAHFSDLQNLTSQFRFWLYEFAPPGADWSAIEAFPFCGIAFNENFFNDNYQKFSFPYLLESLHQRKVDLILRTTAPQLPVECYAALCIRGWQQQHNNHNLFTI